MTGQNLYKPFKNLQTQAEQFIVDKYNKSLEDKYMQGDVESGKVWSKIKELAGTTGPFGMHKLKLFISFLLPLKIIQHLRT